jgi:hypothetical protein
METGYATLGICFFFCDTSSSVRVRVYTKPEIDMSMGVIKSTHTHTFTNNCINFYASFKFHSGTPCTDRHKSGGERK